MHHTSIETLCELNVLQEHSTITVNGLRLPNYCYNNTSMNFTQELMSDSTRTQNPTAVTHWEARALHNRMTRKFKEI